MKRSTIFIRAPTIKSTNQLQQRRHVPSTFHWQMNKEIKASKNPHTQSSSFVSCTVLKYLRFFYKNIELLQSINISVKHCKYCKIHAKRFALHSSSSAKFDEKRFCVDEKIYRFVDDKSSERITSFLSGNSF